MAWLKEFEEIWCLDFEFRPYDGFKTEIICMVARELRSGKLVRLFGDELLRGVPPFSITKKQLFVAYYASAEMDCFFELQWKIPSKLLDLYVEFRNLTSGKHVPSGHGLLGALEYFGLNGIAAVEKEAMRDLALRGGPYSEDEKQALLDYCKADVDALEKLLGVMTENIDVPRALLRSRFMISAAEIERNGIPLDAELLDLLAEKWPFIQTKLVQQLDKFGIYEGSSFRLKNFEVFLNDRRIAWPISGLGRPVLTDETFKIMSSIHPEIASIYELRKTLASLKSHGLKVGKDGKSRTLISAFRSLTGRNQPSNAKYIFGLPSWLRHLIKPQPGQALAYIDYMQQEFGIAAALSGDKAMQAAYNSGDPYLNFAVQSGAAPPGATKDTHPEIRKRFKECALGVQYGMGENALAQKLGIHEFSARELINSHKATYSKFWDWRELIIMHARLSGFLQTVYGWKIHVTPETKTLTLGNFPMQANGAEILRLACCFGSENGIKICGPVHDAVLIEASEEDIEKKTVSMQHHMEMAAAKVLNGFKLRTEARIIKFPDRFTDGRGTEMWNTVMKILGLNRNIV